MEGKRSLRRPLPGARRGVCLKVIRECLAGRPKPRERREDNKSPRGVGRPHRREELPRECPIPAECPRECKGIPGWEDKGRQVRPADPVKLRQAHQAECKVIREWRAKARHAQPEVPAKARLAPPVAAAHPQVCRPAAECRKGCKVIREWRAKGRHAQPEVQVKAHLAPLVAALPRGCRPAVECRKGCKVIREWRAKGRQVLLAAAHPRVCRPGVECRKGCKDTLEWVVKARLVPLEEARPPECRTQAECPAVIPAAAVQEAQAPRVLRAIREACRARRVRTRSPKTHTNSR